MGTRTAGQEALTPMRLLLDTHVALWATISPVRLPLNIRQMIETADNEIYVSVVSLWEIGIKPALGRKSAPPISAAEAALEFERAGFIILPVTAAHALRVEMLPSTHGDPFDRLLLAQALAEPLHFVTHDTALARYGAEIISW